MNNSLNPVSWGKYLNDIIREVGDQRMVQGHPVKGNHARAYYRWVTEGTDPNFFAADRWLSYFEIHIQDYFTFCEGEDIDAWKGPEPEWHGDLLDAVLDVSDCCSRR